MSKSSLLLTTMMSLFFACETKDDEYAYCEGTVSDTADGSAPGFDNDSLIGVEICTDIYRFGVCEEYGGTATVMSEQEGDLANGAEYYCPSVGFEHHCGSEIYVANEEDCPQ